MFKDYQEIILPTYLQSTSFLGSTGQLFNSSPYNVFLAQVTAHHFYLGIVFLTSSITALRIANVLHLNSWDAQLSMNLAIAASLSIAFAHHIYAIPIYPYCASDYPTVLCLFYHHMWVGGFLIIGAAAHASIFRIADNNSLGILNHRDVILGHLLWVSNILLVCIFITTPYKPLVVEKISLMIILFNSSHSLLVGCKAFLTSASILRC